MAPPRKSRTPKSDPANANLPQPSRKILLHPSDAQSLVPSNDENNIHDITALHGHFGTLSLNPTPGLSNPNPTLSDKLTLAPDSCNKGEQEEDHEMALDIGNILGNTIGKIKGFMKKKQAQGSGGDATLNKGTDVEEPATHHEESQANSDPDSTDTDMSNESQENESQIEPKADLFDPEAAALLQPVLENLERLSRTTPSSMPPSHNKLHATSYNTLLKKRLHNIGTFICELTKDEKNGVLERRLCICIQENWWPLKYGEEKGTVTDVTKKMKEKEKFEHLRIMEMYRNSIWFQYYQEQRENEEAEQEKAEREAATRQKAEKEQTKEEKAQKHRKVTRATNKLYSDGLDAVKREDVRRGG